MIERFSRLTGAGRILRVFWAINGTILAVVLAFALRAWL
jgi:hypothetical protein